MKVIKNKKYILLFVFIFAALLVAGTNIYEDAGKSLSLFNQVYKQLLVNYVDEIQPRKFVENGIKDMLKELDPYTVYLSRESRFSLDMLTTGKYGGVGIRIGMRDGILTVISPMDGTPAYRKGILPGDQIIQIDSLKTKGMNLDEAAKLIRGEKGSEVVLTIRRPGYEEPLIFNLVREEIKVHDVSYSGLLTGNIGYIRLTNFSRNSPAEVSRIISDLKKKGMKGLILDLRNNPGGLLSSAIGILELFTEKGDTLLFTKGRTKQSNRIFISRRKPLLGYDFPLVVLINGGSASASEIVSGVIQDLDRGIVIGTRSFGKGLVQSVINLDKESALKITTAKYYTPSHRLIQKEDYFSNNESVIHTGKVDTLFTTRNGRTVKGGGGIYPDIPISPEKYPPFVRSLWEDNLFFRFARDYKSSHSERPSAVEDTLYEQFVEFVHQQGYTYQTQGEKQLKKAEEALKQDSLKLDLKELFYPVYAEYNKVKKEYFTKYRSFIEKMILLELAAIYDGSRGRVEVSLEWDKAVEEGKRVIFDHSVYVSMLEPVYKN